MSNFDMDDMRELKTLEHSRNCAAVQDLYHIGSRGTEFSLKPYLRDRGIFFMAYCPLAMNGNLRQGITENAVLKKIAVAHSATVQQIMLAWAIRDGYTIAIPKSALEKHTVENARAAEIVLTDEELRVLDREFPAPDREVPLDVE